MVRALLFGQHYGIYQKLKWLEGWKCFPCLSVGTFFFFFQFLLMTVELCMFVYLFDFGYQKRSF